MRILHTADWHLGKTLEGRSRLEEQAAMFDELVGIVNDEQIDLVLIAGDVYDSVNPPAAAEQLFYDGLARLSGDGQRQIVVIAGNHDSPDRLAASDPLATQYGIKLLGYPQDGVIHLPIRRTNELAAVFALPYPSESRLNAVLSETVDEAMLQQAYSERIAYLIREQAKNFSPNHVNLMMSHLYVMGGKESDSERPIQVGGAYTVNTEAFIASNLQYVALGHLHRPQQLKGNVPIRYSGSPIAYSFSEAGQVKSVTIVDVSPGQGAQCYELPLNCGRPLVRWKADGGIAEVERWMDEGRDAQAWIDLELHVKHALSMEEIQRLRKNQSGLIHIRPIFPDERSQSWSPAIAGLPIEDLFKHFYMRQTGGAEPEPELVKLFLEILEGASTDEGSAAI